MNLTIAKEFENPFSEEKMAYRANWQPPEDMEIFYLKIPGPEGNPVIRAKVYRPRYYKGKLPVIMNVHGGGFVAGDCEADNTRLESLVMKTPAIAVSIDYRLVPDSVFPDALMDCYTAWKWLCEHAAEIGGDASRMALHGTSAGGNLCAGLVFYLRDHEDPMPLLNILNVPALGLGATRSAEQMRYDSPVIGGDKLARALRMYMGGLNGGYPSYYAVPNVALDYSELPPTFIIAAGCDPLRDESLEYMNHLLDEAIPVDFHLIPGAFHGFNMIPSPTVEMLQQAMILACQHAFEK